MVDNNKEEIENEEKIIIVLGEKYKKPHKKYQSKTEYLLNYMCEFLSKLYLRDVMENEQKKK